MCSIRRRMTWMFLLAALGMLQGCATTSARWNAFLQCRAERRIMRQQMALEEIRAMKEQLDAEDRALQAERELELAQMQSQSEKRACDVRSQYDESVRTKLGLDLDQRVQIGQLQVNMEEMRQLMAERERDYEERVRAYNQQRAQQQGTRAQTQPGPCCTCSVPMCAAPGVTCEAPHLAGCCQRCGQPVQPQTRPQLTADCAGTRPFREAPQKPLQQPITAMEIPLMLPVRMQVGVTNSYVNQSEVRRLPYEQGSRAQVSPSPCGNCEACRCGQPCDHCTSAPRPQPAQLPQVPATEAARIEPPASEAKRVRNAGFERLFEDASADSTGARLHLEDE